MFVLYARLPGLRCAVARRTRALPADAPVAVTDSRAVVDACPNALRLGVRVGQSVARAQRCAPGLLALPADALDPRPGAAAFRDRFADLSPVVEPAGDDALYVDLRGCPDGAWRAACDRAAHLLPEPERLPLRHALGTSKLAARLAAEAGCAFADAPSEGLWPEDPAVGARLARLGAPTCAAVAALGEDALVYALGARVGRPLWQRVLGHDGDAVRALWPPAHVEVGEDLTEAPVDDAPRLERVCDALAERAAAQLRALGRHAREVGLRLATERGERDALWRVPLPVQDPADLRAAVRRLRARLRVDAPVTGARLLCRHLERPPALTPGLFAARTDAERRLALARAHLLLADRYGALSLRRLGDIPLARRDRRRALRAA